MDKDFRSALKGSLTEATEATQQIAKYFKDYGDSGNKNAKKSQLFLASKVVYDITKCENKHLDIYCYIIDKIFGQYLCPEASASYWKCYLDAIRYIYFFLAEMKDFARASLIYKHILFYSNKMQTAEIYLIYIKVYCHHLYLQKFLNPKNPQLAVYEGRSVVKNLTQLLKEALDANTTQKFEYPDLLECFITYLFQKNQFISTYEFLKTLPQDKLKEMFQALFTLYGRQKLVTAHSNEDQIQEHAKYVIETTYCLLQLDMIDKMQLQLSVELMGHCPTESRLQKSEAIAELFLLLYDYLKLLCARKPTADFQQNYNMCCQRFAALFKKHSKNVMKQLWFGNFLVLIFYLHSQLQNLSVFTGFWSQMCHPSSYKSMFQLFMDLMKLAPCIPPDMKLFMITCCTSVRKHVILSFTQITLAVFILYCQNVSGDVERQEDMANRDGNLTDHYKETIQKNIISLINHAFKIIDKMDCITSSSQEMDLILTRFKQATVNCNTNKRADTCVAICELFTKIKTKIRSDEWPLLLRRLYKAVISYNLHVGREIQMCYITALLGESLTKIDVSQLRTQIAIFYANETTSANTNEQPQPHDQCLMQLHHTTTSVLKPYLEPSRKKLLHWLESQHIVKYFKTNTALLHSTLKFSQSQYDFVLITKLGKLQTYAIAKIGSIYKSLKAKAQEMLVLSRLEHLTFGHVCVMLLNDIKPSRKFILDSKDLSEDQLENLLTREEMSSFTIQNDLKRFQLVWEAFKAFENFYEKFDSEIITMDDAIIDWESLLDDLSSLALCLQLSGFLEHSSEIWYLHYKCSRLIHDDFSTLRGLAFFCEYSEHFEQATNKRNFTLEREIKNNFPIIIHGLENLSNLPRQAYQTYILLAVLQIAHYYARSSRLSFAQMLLQYVDKLHCELNERQGRYDIVLATKDAIKFRLLWKNFDDSKTIAQEKSLRTAAENLLLHRCLLHEIEETLERFIDFTCISSCDALLYSMLIINMVQELAECTVNRLCDNFIHSFFIAALKCSLGINLALRFVQVISMWMWVNLQMEYVDKAQIKLKLIECVLGIKSLKEVNEKCSKSLQVYSEDLTTYHQNTGLEAIRKLSQVQLSPIKNDKLQLQISPSYRKSDLNRYFKCNIDSKFLPQNEQIEWTLFMVGCLNARLFFLVDDYDQLQAFYESGNQWLQMRQNIFNKKHYKNIHLMATQHYANFLRARKEYDKALQCLENGMEMCENKKFYIDAVYYANFQLQLIATRREKNDSRSGKINVPTTHSKPRRALNFNTSPASKRQQESAKKQLKEKMLQSVKASAKKSSAIMKPPHTQATDIGCSSTKKIKTHTQVDAKAMKPNLKFNICEDSFDGVEIIDDIDDVIVIDDSKTTIKRTKLAEENEKMYKTPKVVRKTTKSTTRNKKIELIDISDSPTSSSSSSSLENLDPAENINANELVPKMQNLEIKDRKTTKTSTTEMSAKTPKSQRKPRIAKEPSTAAIVLEDSPPTNVVSKTQMASNSVRQTRTATKNKAQAINEQISASASRPRRPRKLVLDNNEKPNLENNPPEICIMPPTPCTTSRKRQKNLI